MLYLFFQKSQSLIFIRQLKAEFAPQLDVPRDFMYWIKFNSKCSAIKKNIHFCQWRERQRPNLSREETDRGLSREEPDRGLSREGNDLDPGPSGRDRGNLQKGVFVKKRETASFLAVTGLCSYVQ